MADVGIRVKLVQISGNCRGRVPQEELSGSVLSVRLGSPVLRLGDDRQSDQPVEPLGIETQ